MFNKSTSLRFMSLMMLTSLMAPMLVSSKAAATPVRDAGKVESRFLTAAKGACAALYSSSQKNIPGLEQALAPIHQKMDAFCENPQADQVVIRDLMDVARETLASSEDSVVVRSHVLQVYNHLNYTLQTTFIW
ncbi:MAG: hypothetical protein OM95_01885 [Bdellovibrio sp. ArHS]|uniref:hypothetical protein n=1 Tax=Bdellovibrio sp. ArHS TaxID=1569284 RepID=UPI0005833934|nr:hypothetical protein [Bdellovibrio sp. ArHS]KHD89836.1 MAG: hypothetical protein OM95_01885 [Bdellovibrio sp. ArHS]